MMGATYCLKALCLQLALVVAPQVKSEVKPGEGGFGAVCDLASTASCIAWQADAVAMKRQVQRIG